MRTKLMIVCLPVLLAACASRHEPGWQGEQADPYGTADTVCMSEADQTRASEHAMAYRACMARHGWTQPPASNRD